MSSADLYKIRVFGTWYDLPEDIFDSKKYPACSKCGQKYVPITRGDKECFACGIKVGRPMKKKETVFYTPPRITRKAQSSDYIIGEEPRYKSPISIFDAAPTRTVKLQKQHQRPRRDNKCSKKQEKHIISHTKEEIDAIFKKYAQH